MLWPNTHQNALLLFVSIWRKQWPGSCFLGLKGHSDPSCTHGVGTVTILWVSPIFCRLSFTALLWALKGNFNQKWCRCLVSFMCAALYIWCLSVYPVWSVALPAWVPGITHWQINGLSWPCSLLHAALCGWPAHNSNTAACLWGYRLNTEACTVFYWHKETCNKPQRRRKKSSETEFFIWVWSVIHHILILPFCLSF